MGLCGSVQISEAERATDKQIDDNQRADEERENTVLKLLLLGGGGSGKSTMLKQMMTIYGAGFKKAELEGYTPLVHSNVIKSIQDLINQSKKWSSERDPSFGYDEKLEKQCQHLLDLDAHDDESKLNEQLAGDVAMIWADPGIKKCFSLRHEFYIQDSAEYFFEKVKDIGTPGYIATTEDHLRIRTPTTGVTETAFEVAGNVFRMFDVGGQRSERKKWIHCFENVQAVLFVAAISSYNQALWEDSKTNRLVEALALFEEITNSKWFKKTSIILFLNKRDLFAKKFLDYPITACPALQHYKGDLTSFKETTEFIQNEFLVLNNSPKTIYSHITCATDKSNVQVVFDSVKDTILKQSLDSAVPGWS